MGVWAILIVAATLLVSLQVAAGAPGGPADYKWYDDGAPYSLIGWEDKVSEDILRWLTERFPHR